jgi:Na+-driven multidrug efflux pump
VTLTIVCSALLGAALSFVLMLGQRLLLKRRANHRGALTQALLLTAAVVLIQFWFADYLLRTYGADGIKALLALGCGYIAGSLTAWRLLFLQRRRPDPPSS